MFWTDPNGKRGRAAPAALAGGRGACSRFKLPALSRQHRGFSLLEVLVAMTLIGVGILGVLSAFSLSIQAASRSRGTDGATEIAQNQLDLAVHAPTDRLEARSGTSGRYTWHVSYSKGPDGLTTASVAVQWSDRGDKRLFTLSRWFDPDR